MKQHTKVGILGVVAVFALLVIIAVSAAAFGYNNSREKGQLQMHGMMLAGHENMKEMHQEMTRNMGPELKKQLDSMHEKCEKSITDDSNEFAETMMHGRVNNEYNA